MNSIHGGIEKKPSCFMAHCARTLMVGLARWDRVTWPPDAEEEEMAFGSPKSVLIATLLMAAAGHSVLAQDATSVQAQPDTPSAAARSLEDLNMRGGAVAMPPFSDSVIDVNSAERQQLLKHGLAIREIIQLQFVQNILEAPVAADQQVYVGQRAFTSAMSNPILTWDMRQLGLQHAQLNVSGVWQWVSWEPAGPKAFDLWTLYFFKAFAGDRVEIKAGYNSNDLEFVGMQVGGSTASGVQGVYAVLPYEVGMAFFPLPAPQVNLKIKGPDRLYLKSGVQRSLDAAGGPADEARNHTGLRFDPKGDKLLIIEEGGFRREASATERETWFRAGYLRNSTLYTDMSSGKQERRVCALRHAVAQAGSGRSLARPLPGRFRHDRRLEVQCLRPLLRGPSLPDGHIPEAPRRRSLVALHLHRPQQIPDGRIGGKG
jgi:porin